MAHKAQMGLLFLSCLASCIAPARCASPPDAWWGLRWAATPGILADLPSDDWSAGRGGIVYTPVSASEGDAPTVVALSTDLGRPLWSVPASGFITQAIRVADGPLLISSEELGQVRALDASSGRQLWSRQVEKPRGCGSCSVSLRMSPVTNGIVLLTPRRLALVQLSPWRVAWSRDLQGDGRFLRYRQPVIADGKVFIIVGYYAATRRLLIVADLNTGRLLWRSDLGNIGWPTEPEEPIDLGACAVQSQRCICLRTRTDFGDATYRKDLTPVLVCLNAGTGKEEWATPLAHWPRHVSYTNFVQPVLTEHYVVLDLEDRDAPDVILRQAHDLTNGSVVGSMRLSQANMPPSGPAYILAMRDTVVAATDASELAVYALPSFERLQGIRLPKPIDYGPDVSGVLGDLAFRYVSHVAGESCVIAGRLAQGPARPRQDQ